MKLQSLVMFDKSGNNSKFGKDEVLLIRELFGFKPGENPVDADKIASEAQLRKELEAHKETLVSKRE